MSPALKKLQWKAYSYRHIIIIECLMAWERNTGYALEPPDRGFQSDQGQEDFPERVILTLNPMEGGS